MFPPLRVRIRPENLLQLKNNDYERLLVKNLMWYSSLIDDLRLISIDASTGDEKADACLLHDVNLLILRAEQERAEIENMIHKVYKDTSPTDTLALNSVSRHRQDRIVGWQQDFDRLPKPRQLLLPEKEKRSSSTFGSMRNMFPRRAELISIFDQFPPGRDADGENVFFPRRIVSDPATSASESEPFENLRNKALKEEAKRALELTGLTGQDQVVGSLGKEIVALPPVSEASKSEMEAGADSDTTIEASIAPDPAEDEPRISKVRHSPATLQCVIQQLHRSKSMHHSLPPPLLLSRALRTSARPRASHASLTIN
jgi:1-phosphatidylinositol-3-phosphate 5-kinase